MGMVFQRFNLFPNKTVLENVAISPIHVKKVNPETARKEAKVLLKRVGLADKINIILPSFQGDSNSGWLLQGL